MKAIVFAAGLGTRLRPFTLSHPKALVPVGGVPMLGRVILKLRDAGIREVVVNVHHFASQIVDYLRENGNFGIDIHISDETGLLLETGGGILKARRWLQDSPFVVHNADILTDFSLSGMIAAHNEADPLATLLVADRNTSRYLLFDHDMDMRGWTNVSTAEVRPAGLCIDGLQRLAFGGVHVLSPAVFPLLEAFRGAGVPFSIMDFYISLCSGTSDDSCFTAKPSVIKGFAPSMPYTWHDIGKPESLAAANACIADLRKNI